MSFPPPNANGSPLLDRILERLQPGSHSPPLDLRDQNSNDYSSESLRTRIRAEAAAHTESLFARTMATNRVNTPQDSKVLSISVV